MSLDIIDRIIRIRKKKDVPVDLNILLQDAAEHILFLRAEINGFRSRNLERSLVEYMGALGKNVEKSTDSSNVAKLSK